VTIKFPSVSLYDVRVSTCLVDSYEDYNYFGEVIFLLLCPKFQNGTRAAIKFYVKLKKTASETFEMLKSAYGKNVYREQVYLNDIKVSKRH
jgi:hypothetical protein